MMSRQGGRTDPGKEPHMTFVGLIARNIASRPLRAALTASAVAIGVMAVVALGVLTTSLKETATQILEVGNADFTISQKHTDDILNSTISQDDIDAIGKVPGVKKAVGALISTDSYDADNPVVIEVGLNEGDQAPFGVNILEGKSYTDDATDQVMLGYALAKSIKKNVGDTMTVDGKDYEVMGLYRTNVSFGNSTMMMPLAHLQGDNQLAGQVTLGFVQVDKGANIKKVRAAIDGDFQQLTTIETAEDFGRADRNLTLIGAANTGGSLLAGLIAITGVLNTSLLSFFERIREFGIYRSIGWSRLRVISLVIGEAIVVSIVGAAVGVFLGWGAINVLENLKQLKGIFKPTYDAAIFWRSLGFGLVVAFLGALYPALRAALVAPITAVRRE
jgi:putative ABC transport system permease protein